MLPPLESVPPPATLGRGGHKYKVLQSHKSASGGNPTRASGSGANGFLTRLPRFERRKTMRHVALLIAVIGLFAVPASLASASGMPTRAPVPDSANTATFPAGLACDFTLQIEPVVNHEYTLTFPAEPNGDVVQTRRAQHQPDRIAHPRQPNRHAIQHLRGAVLDGARCPTRGSGSHKCQGETHVGTETVSHQLTPAELATRDEASGEESRVVTAARSAGARVRR
jgi:hypothetical protein